MNRSKLLRWTSFVLIGLTATGILMVALMAFANPQSVMDLVQVKLPNNDAYSSIRGSYGGAGLTIFIWLVFLAIRNPLQGLAFVSLFCGLYALSRVLTIILEGSLGAFGRQWLFVEATLSALALLTLLAWRRNKTA